jgi:hypothetical protein
MPTAGRPSGGRSRQLGDAQLQPPAKLAHQVHQVGVLGFVRAKDFRGRARDRLCEPRVQPELVGDDAQRQVVVGHRRASPRRWSDRAAVFQHPARSLRPGAALALAFSSRSGFEKKT